MHHHEHTEYETDRGLLRRLRGISWTNAAIGAVELAAGALANSATLTMAGVHDTSDGVLYDMKHRAACERDHARKQRLRRRGAAALMGVTVAIGGYEIAHDLTHPNQKPEPIAAAVGVLAAGANITAASVIHGKRHDHNAHDSWKHVAGVDLPSSLITAAITPASLQYPELDVVGTSLHMALGVGFGIATWIDIKRQDKLPHMS